MIIWLGWWLFKFVFKTTSSLGSKWQLDELVNSLSSNDKCYGSPKPWSNKTLNFT
jgi:hypothetical protein